jgi:hypothetical protein
MSESPHSRGIPSRVGDLISGPGTDAAKNLGAFYHHARLLAGLDSLLSGHLGPDLANHVQVANLRQEQLILLTPSASVATRLKVQAAELLDFLHISGHSQIRRLEVRVAPLQKPDWASKVPRQANAAAREAADLINRLTKPRID